MELYKSFKFTTLMSSLIMIALGLLLALKPELSIKMISYGIASAVLLFGIVNLISYFKKKAFTPTSAMLNLIFAIFSILLGLLIIIKPLLMASLIPIFLGLIIIVDGSLLLFAGLTYRKFLPKQGLTSIIIGIIIIIFGCIVVLYPFATELVLMTFIGISLVLTGATNLTNQLLIEFKTNKNEPTL
ncbi:MAG TPA: DUF308 domain-containing protein [Anaerovoracaceae bacterium]|nr:DUF308 domain-containing protein [Anaerovoracaceae bacterium]